MAFIKATAPGGARPRDLLSADNDLPERHIVIDTIRTAAPRLGLTASVIATLDAMLSCLAPKRNHHTVFASNATLTFRRNGVSDRTIRRHAAVLEEGGFLKRQDSANKKRFTKHSAREGMTLRFGFDLSPLFDQLQKIAQIAAEVMQEKEQINYLRCKIRTAANYTLRREPQDEMATAALKMLRRKLTVNDYQNLLEKLQATPVEAEVESNVANEGATFMTASDSQNVRHHHRSNKEHIDKKAKTDSDKPIHQRNSKPITMKELLAACPAALQFSPTPIETEYDAIKHARILAPMMGITNQCYQAAQERLGSFNTAATVWAVMQIQDRVKSMGAYFRTITTGSKSCDFDPQKLLRRLAMAHE